MIDFFSVVPEASSHSLEPYFASYSLQDYGMGHNLLSAYLHKSNAMYKKFIRMPSKGEYAVAVSSIGLKTEEKSFLLLASNAKNLENYIPFCHAYREM